MLYEVITAVGGGFALVADDDSVGELDDNVASGDLRLLEVVEVVAEGIDLADGVVVAVAELDVGVDRGAGAGVQLSPVHHPLLGAGLPVP